MQHGRSMLGSKQWAVVQAADQTMLMREKPWR